MTRTSPRPCLRVRPGVLSRSHDHSLVLSYLKKPLSDPFSGKADSLAFEGNGGNWRLPRVVLAEGQRRASIRVGSKGQAEHPMRMR